MCLRYSSCILTSHSRIYYEGLDQLSLSQCQTNLICSKDFHTKQMRGENPLSKIHLCCIFNDPHNMNTWWWNVGAFILTFCTCITAWTRDISLKMEINSTCPESAMSLGKQTCSNLESIPLMLFSDWTSPTSWWVERRPPDLVSHLASPLWISTICLASTWNQSSVCSLVTMEALSHHKAGQLTPILHPACHCLPNYPLALSIWWTIYDDLLYLVLKPQQLGVPQPLKILVCPVDFHPGHRHKWQTLTKPQVCADCSFFGLRRLYCHCVSCRVRA